MPRLAVCAAGGDVADAVENDQEDARAGRDRELLDDAERIRQHAAILWDASGDAARSLLEPALEPQLFLPHHDGAGDPVAAETARFPRP